MYKIGIVGYGYVGKGIHRLFGDWVKAIYDPYYAKTSSESDFKGLDLVVICVPTNTAKDGWSCDASIVKKSVKWLMELDTTRPLILIKSAVVPSEVDRIKREYTARIVVSPEYMGEGKYFVPFWKYADPVEMKYHDFQIFGGDKEDTSACVDIFVKKMGPHVDYYQVDLKTAALCKYMENSWGAAKVTFANEWYEIAKAHGSQTGFKANFFGLFFPFEQTFIHCSSLRSQHRA